jgi:hypothetical protein
MNYKIMRTFTRKCIKDFKQEGFELKFNEEYLTSDIMEDNTVVVFTSYWARVPLEFFTFGETETPPFKLN